MFRGNHIEPNLDPPEPDLWLETAIEKVWEEAKESHPSIAQIAAILLEAIDDEQLQNKLREVATATAHAHWDEQNEIVEDAKEKKTP